MNAGAVKAHEDAEFGRRLSRLLSVFAQASWHKRRRTHCGLGAPQSTQLLFSFSFCMSRSYKCTVSHQALSEATSLHTFVFVSGSTSHILKYVRATALYGVESQYLRFWKYAASRARYPERRTSTRSRVIKSHVVATWSKFVGTRAILRLRLFILRDVIKAPSQPEHHSHSSNHEMQMHVRHCLNQRLHY